MQKVRLYMYLTTYILRTMLYVSLKLILKAVFNVVSINQIFLIHPSYGWTSLLFQLFFFKGKLNSCWKDILYVHQIHVSINPRLITDRKCCLSKLYSVFQGIDHLGEFSNYMCHFDRIAKIAQFLRLVMQSSATK